MLIFFLFAVITVAIFIFVVLVEDNKLDQAFVSLLSFMFPIIISISLIMDSYEKLKTWESRVEAHVVTVDGVQFTFVNNPFHDNEITAINLTKKFNRVFDKKVNLIVKKDSIWTPYDKWVELDKE